jgi:hypothetical protein
MNGTLTFRDRPVTACVVRGAVIDRGRGDPLAPARRVVPVAPGSENLFDVQGSMAELSLPSSSIPPARRTRGEPAGEEAAGSTVAQVLNGSNSTAHRAPSVLIADDHRLFGGAMSSALSGEGMRVVGVVTSAEEAIAEVALSRPDLVLLALDLLDATASRRGRPSWP